MLGKAKKVMIEKENTTIVSGAGKKADIEARINQNQGADRGDHLGLRTAGSCRSAWPSLRAAVAVIRVGGATEIEGRSARIASTMRCMRPAPRSRKAFCRAAASPCCVPSSP